MVESIYLFIYCKLNLKISHKGLGTTKPPGYNETYSFLRSLNLTNKEEAYFLRLNFAICCCC